MKSKILKMLTQQYFRAILCNTAFSVSQHSSALLKHELFQKFWKLKENSDDYLKKNKTMSIDLIIQNHEV